MLCGDFDHSQTLQMGVYHFSGLFVLLCLGLGSALLTSLGEHVFYRLVLPRIRRGNKLQYWLHTSQVRKQDKVGRGSWQPRTPPKHLSVPLEDPPSPQYRTTRGATGEGRAGAQVSRGPEGHRLSGQAGGQAALPPPPLSQRPQGRAARHRWCRALEAGAPGCGTGATRAFPAGTWGGWRGPPVALLQRARAASRAAGAGAAH